MTDDTPEERLGFWLGKRFNEVDERLDRIEADLAEIKARLAHASPGYDMDKRDKACETCRMWWADDDGKLGACWLQTGGNPSPDETAPITKGLDFCTAWTPHWPAKTAGEQEEGR